jgi:nitrite reductase/ring-hydroxylating ferredoxin subunit
MAVNSTALALVAIGAIFRDWDTLVPTWPTILLELAALALVTWGGWLGGTLVYRNQIAVDHRYAHAGKWHEQTIEATPGQPAAIEGATEMKPGQMRLLHCNNRRIVLARTDEGFAAFDDHCTHKGGPLSDGALICNTVQCPWHGSQFDVTTGANKAGPAEKPINTHPTELRDGKVFVTLPQDQTAPS